MTEWWIGIADLDLRMYGKRKCVACITDEADNKMETISYENTYASALECAKSLKMKYGECKAACEATGSMWIKDVDAFEDAGVPIMLANPLKNKWMVQKSAKTDKIDAYVLARLLRLNAIHPCYVTPRHMRGPKMLQRHRIDLVQKRAKAVVALQDMLERFDLHVGESGSHNICGPQCLQWISRQAVGHAAEFVLRQRVDHIRHLNAQIEEAERKIAVEADKSENVRLLMSITGLDYFGALLLDTEIGDWNRFSDPYQLVSWVGMCPRVYQSGDTKHYGRMKKDSNRRTNWMLIQAAHSATRHDPKLAVLYERARRNHPHAVAVTHVARRIIIVAWCMMTRREKYRAVNEDLYRKKLRRLKSRCKNA